MSFRKRNIGLSSSSPRSPASSNSNVGDGKVISPVTATKPLAPIPGVRPSPLDGRPTTSTGTPSLDAILAGHAGLALGNSLLIEELGTTDYAGALLRYYAAEGLVQGHMVHVVGVGEQWGRELPGLVGPAEVHSESDSPSKERKERMKIAWRYERLGEFGSGAAGPRGGIPLSLSLAARVHSQQWIIHPRPAQQRLLCDILMGIGASSTLDRTSLHPATVTDISNTNPNVSSSFCHLFDLAKRLEMPANSVINFIPITGATLNTSPFTHILRNITNRISTGQPATIHRLVFPGLLSPALYPPHASNPHHILQFLHCLRSLLRQYPTQLTAVFTLPLSLYPRSNGLVRWIELLFDGVLELAPFPHTSSIGNSIGIIGATTTQEEQPHGLLKIHRLPVFHERGGGGSGGTGGGVGDDLAFMVSRRKFVIKPFNLPPVEGDTEAQKGEVDVKQTKIDIDF